MPARLLFHRDTPRRRWVTPSVSLPALYWKDDARLFCGEEFVQHGRGQVEGLRHRDECHAVPVEHLDQLREVGQRAAEAVDLVDNEHVDQTVLDVLQQSLQAGALQRAAGDAAVVIGRAVRVCPPAVDYSREF
jgi:hypothetical protein